MLVIMQNEYIMRNCHSIKITFKMKKINGINFNFLLFEI